MNKRLSPHIDNEDLVLLRRYLEKWERRVGPRVGDFVILLDGSMQRFAHDHGDRIQPSTDAGSFYFDGLMDYSGGLGPAIMKTDLEDTGRRQDGSAWFFHHNVAKAHNGVACCVKCRVYRVRPRHKDDIKLAA